MLDKNEIRVDIIELKESFIMRIKKPTLDDLYDAREFYKLRIKECKHFLTTQTYTNCTRLFLSIKKMIFKCLYDYFLEITENIIKIYHEGMRLMSEDPIDDVTNRLIEEVNELLGD